MKNKKRYRMLLNALVELHEQTAVETDAAYDAAALATRKDYVRSLSRADKLQGRTMCLQRCINYLRAKEAYKP